MKKVTSKSPYRNDLYTQFLIKVLDRLTLTSNPHNPREVWGELPALKCHYPAYMTPLLHELRAVMTSVDNDDEPMDDATVDTSALIDGLTQSERESVALKSLRLYVTRVLPQVDAHKMTHFCIAVRRVLTDTLRLEYTASEFVGKTEEWGVARPMACTLGRLIDNEWNYLNTTPFHKWVSGDGWGNDRIRKFDLIRDQGKLLQDLILEELLSKTRKKPVRNPRKKSKKKRKS